MASQPPNWPQRSSSQVPANPDQEEVAGIVPSTTEAPLTTPEDPQTVTPNQKHDNDGKTETSDRSDAATAATSPRPSTSQPEPRHCWICLQDEGEDNPNTSEWKSPCPCNLRAHEECLLEWITELEATNARQAQISRAVIECPQCKSQIKIQRPRDIIVQLTYVFRRVGRVLVLPAGISAIIGCLYSGSMVYGINALHLVFGSEETHQMLATAPTIFTSLTIWEQTWYGSLARLLRTTDPFLPIAARSNWHAWISLPFIAPALVLSRTSLADPIFSILPVGYFMVQHDIRGLRQWPPSAGLTFATLPYLRSLYNEFYKQAFGQLEKKWDRAVMRKPREGETADEVARAQEQQPGQNNFLGVDFEMEIIHRHEERIIDEHGHEIVPEQPLPPNPDMEMPAPDPARPQGFAPPGAPAPPEPEPEAGGRPVQGNDWEFRRNISTAQVMTSVMGALFFPAVSSVMGDLLKYTLPTKWVTYQPRTTLKGIQAAGLLQEKWGRSVVGGCLFVVLKDALILYCKWRLAQSQGKLKVLDYVVKRERKAKSGATVDGSVDA